MLLLECSVSLWERRYKARIACRAYHGLGATPLALRVRLYAATHGHRLTHGLCISCGKRYGMECAYMVGFVHGMYFACNKECMQVSCFNPLTTSDSVPILESMEATNVQTSEATYRSSAGDTFTFYVTVVAGIETVTVLTASGSLYGMVDTVEQALDLIEQGS